MLMIICKPRRSEFGEVCLETIFRTLDQDRVTTMSRRMAALAALAETCSRAAGHTSRGVFESRARGFSAWQPPTAATRYAHPGYMGSASPGTYHRESSENCLPWSLQDLHRQKLLFSNQLPKLSSDAEEDHNEGMQIKVAETRKIMMHVNSVALKKRLKMDSRDSFSYRTLLDLIKESNIAASDEEAMRCAHTFDEAGVVLIFRENVYPHPERIGNLIAHALLFAVVPANDPRRQELMKLEDEKVKIDELAHKLVRRYVWTGLGGLTCQAALFFRLTFWDLSWDVMEPIAFFVTSGYLIAGYTYFLVTAKDPSYQDCRQRLFYSKQLKLFKKMKFDYLRYDLLRRQCQCLGIDDMRL